jgi:tyrosine-protein phosphatase YwqE
MGKVDLHSHLIYGVDDGVATLAEALDCVAGLIERGYDRIFTTPHQVEYWRPAPEVLAARLAELCAEIRTRGWPVRVGMGAENHVDDEFLRRMRSANLLSYGLAGKAVLVECSPMSPPPFLEQLIFELRAGGLTPVLAHPERYPWMAASRDRAARLRKLGCLMQADTGSFAGAYGRDARKSAEKLLAAGDVDLVASDLHKPAKLGPLVDQGLAALASRVPAAEVKRLTEEAPGAIFSAAAGGAWAA